MSARVGSYTVRLAARAVNVSSRERRLSLLHVQLLTFYQSCKATGGEQLRRADRSCAAIFFSKKRCGKSFGPANPAQSPSPASKTAPVGALRAWQTLRDLRDGLVDPAVALEAAEGHFSQRASERTSQLLVLLQTFTVLPPTEDYRPVRTATPPNTSRVELLETIWPKFSITVSTI